MTPDAEATPNDQSASLIVYPLMPDRWPDLDALFGPRGATGGCWCMYWRLTRSQFDYQKGDANREAFRDIVTEASIPPGLLAYRDGVPIGWCAIAPRADYGALERSRVLKRVDDEPVWSITCFFVARAARRQGVTRALIEAAVAFAVDHGASLIEAYPIDPGKPDVPAVFAWTGFASAFEQAGFIEVARRSDSPDHAVRRE